jgi:hypothetical protein
MAAPTDPKSVLAALLAGDELPFPADAREAAQGLARAPESAQPAALEALPEPLALAVLEAAVRAQATALPEALAASSNKALAKAGKKALYRLRSSGVAVESPARPVEPAPQAAPESEEAPPALLSAVTGNGERAMILARPVRGGLETAHLVLNDEKGVIHLALHEASRGTYRKQLKEVRQGRTPPAVELSLAEAKDRLAAAVHLNERSGTPHPNGLTELLRHLDVTPRETATAIPAPAPGESAGDAEGAALHQEKELSEWLPDEPQLRALAQLWDGLSPEERADRPLTEARFRQAAQAYFTQPLRALYAHRLWEMADFFERTDRPTPAGVARAQARALAHGEALPGFAQELFVKVIRLTKEALAATPGMGAAPAALRPPPLTASVAPERKGEG